MTTIQDFILHLGIQLSNEEREKCLPTAIKMVNLTKIARLEGIFALENEIEEDNEFMKLAVNLMFQDMGINTVEKILYNSILAGGYTKIDLLERLIITQGLVATFNFYTPFVTANIVGSILGEKYIKELIAITNITIDLNAYIDKNTVALPQSTKFEKRLLQLTRAELCRVLRPMHNLIITEAFKGCSKFFIGKMRDGISSERFTQICEAFANAELPEKGSLRWGCFEETVLEHQDIILKHLKELEASGIIIKIDN